YLLSECTVVIKFHRDPLYVVKEEEIRKLGDVLTLSYLMDLWLCREVLPQF
ncbi:Hypothetical protein SMAX5B_001943, partial [Scophthalmus maximus]